MMDVRPSLGSANHPVDRHVTEISLAFHSTLAKCLLCHGGLPFHGEAPLDISNCFCQALPKNFREGCPRRALELTKGQKHKRSASVGPKRGGLASCSGVVRGAGIRGRRLGLCSKRFQFWMSGIVQDSASESPSPRD